MDSCFPPLAALSLKDSSKLQGGDATSTLQNQDLSAQLANYTKIEILQDLDLYYIRQIAHKYKELDLEQKIELELKMREGSAKLLAASRQQAQSLEAARALLTSNERMSAYLAELQRRRKTSQDPRVGSILPYSGCRARVSLSELRMPLMWRGADHFKNRGDYRRFAVFCLARLGTDIFDTSLVCPVDRSLTDVTFPDVMLFSGATSEFRVRLEVYSHLLAEDLSMASTPRKLQRSLHSSISRTVGKKLAASLRDELHGSLGPQFQLVAWAELTLEEVDDGVRTHDLEVATLENRSQELPLFGHFCCRLAAQPDRATSEGLSGEMSLRQDKLPWRGAALRLRGFTLSTWPAGADLEREEAEAEATLPVDKESRVVEGAGLELTVSRLCDGEERAWTIRFARAEERQRWTTQLAETITDHKRWGRAAERSMHLPSPGSARHHPGTPCRQGSLYEQTPLIENLQSPSQSNNDDLLSITPATSLSSCSSSSSSSPTSTFRAPCKAPFRDRAGSGGTGLRATLRGHWPFKQQQQP